MLDYAARDSGDRPTLRQETIARESSPSCRSGRERQTAGTKLAPSSLQESGPPFQTQSIESHRQCNVLPQAVDAMLARRAAAVPNGSQQAVWRHDEGLSRADSILTLASS